MHGLVSLCSNTRSMASTVERARDPLSNPFRAGTYVFTRSQAINCAALHKAGVTVWRLKEEFHPNATLNEIVVAIQVGIMTQSDIQNLDDLDPQIFEPKYVCLGMWKVGKPTQRNE